MYINKLNQHDFFLATHANEYVALLYAQTLPPYFYFAISFVKHHGIVDFTAK